MLIACGTCLSLDFCCLHVDMVLTNFFLFVAYRENLSARSILVMASASLVQIANLTILWEPLCMELQPHRQVMRQPCTTSWHPHQGILKDCSMEGQEDHIGFPNLIPSKYPPAMEALSERRHKPPSSAFLHAYPHSCLFSNYLSKHSMSWSCTGPCPSFLRCFDLLHSSASPCITLRQEKVLAYPTLVPVCPQKINGVTILIYPCRIHIQDTLTPWSLCCSYTGDLRWTKLTKLTVLGMQYLSLSFPHLPF